MSCTHELCLLRAGVACPQLFLLGGVDELLQHGLHDGRHHGGGGGVGEPHGQHGGTAHEAEQEPGRRGQAGRALAYCESRPSLRTGCSQLPTPHRVGAE